jgi:hypothetical protein
MAAGHLPEWRGPRVQSSENIIADARRFSTAAKDLLFETLDLWSGVERDRHLA